MNFGQNFYTWLLSNAQPLVLAGIVIIGIYLIFKKEFTKLVVFGIVAVLSCVLVFNASGIQGLFTQLGNMVLGL